MLNNAIKNVNIRRNKSFFKSAFVISNCCIIRSDLTFTGKFRNSLRTPVLLFLHIYTVIEFIKFESVCKPVRNHANRFNKRSFCLNMINFSKKTLT